MEILFGRKVRTATAGTFATRVITRGVDVTVNAYYKHSRIKQYLKDGRALRVETVVNDTGDLGRPSGAWNTWTCCRPGPGAINRSPGGH